MSERKSYGRVRLGWIGAVVIVAVGALLIPMGQGEQVKSNPKTPAVGLANATILPEGIAELFELDKEGILKRFGEPKSIFTVVDGRGQIGRHTLDDLPETYGLCYDDLTVGISKGKVGGIVLLDEKYVFGNGIHVGHREQKIVEAFGPHFTRKEHSTKDILTYEHLGLSFEVYKPDGIALEIEIRRPSVFAQQLAQGIDRLDIDSADRQEVIRIFGEPEDYGARGETYQADQLPSWYIMGYPLSFSVVMNEDRISEIRHGDRSPYVFENGLRIGLSPEQVFKCVGKPKEVVTGKNEYKKDVFYKDIDGNRGHCYCYFPDRRLRLWFSGNKLVAMYKTRSDWR